jgi:hypothetical protein
MSPSILIASVVALALVSPATSTYVLDPTDNYSGANFFNNWDFITVYIQTKDVQGDLLTLFEDK